MFLIFRRYFGYGWWPEKQTRTFGWWPDSAHHNRCLLWSAFRHSGHSRHSNESLPPKAVHICASLGSYGPGLREETVHLWKRWRHGLGAWFRNWHGWREFADEKVVKQQLRFTHCQGCMRHEQAHLVVSLTPVWLELYALCCSLQIYWALVTVFETFRIVVTFFSSSFFWFSADLSTNCIR